MFIYNYRCPWCGNDLRTKGNYKKGIMPRYVCKCQHCQNLYTKKMFHFMCIVSVAVLLMGLFEYHLHVTLQIILSTLGATMYIIFMYKAPIVRYPPEGIFEQNSELGFSVKIIWNLKYPFIKYRIWNNYILPICFVSDNEKPISMVWCVKISRMRRKKNNTFAKMSFLLEDVPKDIAMPNYRFVVFYEKKIIGEGTVIK